MRKSTLKHWKFKGNGQVIYSERDVSHKETMAKPGDVDKKVKKGWLSRIKARAKKNRLPFNLDITDLDVPERCPILDIPLYFHFGRRGSKKSSPSVDRIKPEKGYVKGNVKIISRHANSLKNALNLEQMEKLCEYMRKNSEEISE